MQDDLPSSTPLRLETFQSMWAMEDLPFGSGASWTVDEQVSRIKNAGFDGIAIDLGAKNAATSDTMAGLAAEYELATAVFAFVSDDDDLARATLYANAVGANRMVVCACLFGFDTAALVAVLRRWKRYTADHGIDMQLETHRNTATNDLRLTSRLMEELDEDLLLAIDLSHYVCGSEIPDESTPEIEGHLDRILSRAGSIQGRIATRSQVQVPLGFPQHRHWEEHFMRWWSTGFGVLRDRHRAGSDVESVMFCTELGTTPYAITDAAGQELSDRWAEALLLRQWAMDVFETSGVHAS